MGLEEEKPNRPGTMAPPPIPRSRLTTSKIHSILSGRIEKTRTSPATHNIKRLEALAKLPAGRVAELRGNLSSAQDSTTLFGRDEAGAGLSPEPIEVDGDGDSHHVTNGTANGQATVGSRSSSPAYEDEDTEMQSWRKEQLELNQLIKARNEYTFLPSTWRISLRGIPLPESLFYLKTKARSTRPRIYAHQERYENRGTMVLRKLIEVHGRIRDLRNKQSAIRRNPELDDRQKRDAEADMVDSMIKCLRRVINEALDWAHHDGNFARFGDQLPSNIKLIELKDEDTEHDVLIQDEMHQLAQTWRDKISNAKARQKPSREAKSPTTGNSDGGDKDENEEDELVAPVVFGFVMYRHTFLLVTLDADDEEAACNIPISLNMEEKNQHQWNALTIMVTLCWARDLLERVANKLELHEEAASDSSDPDE